MDQALYVQLLFLDPSDDEYISLLTNDSSQ